LKSIISRGLIFDLPSIYHGRLIKLLAARYPDYRAFFVFSGMGETVTFLKGCLGDRFDQDRISDPARNEAGEVCFDRPFLPPDSRKSGKNVRVLLPILPFRLGDCPIVACLRDRPRTVDIRGATLSPLILSGLLRATRDLDRFSPPPWFAEGSMQDPPGWTQRGPYMIPRCGTAEYPEVFGQFLNQGLLLSPYFTTPSILPGEASEGELKKMIRLFHQIPGK
jgi:hypothetical protein